MKTRKDLMYRLLLALLTGALALLAGWLFWGSAIDGIASDALYQRRVSTDGEVVVLGIDQRALEEIGPLPWTRDVMADVVALLNADPDSRPAVIGLDVLYVGESADPDADAYLADVCAQGGNVVVAGAATFGSQVVEDAQGFHMDTRAVLAWDGPYEALAEGTFTGSINAMADEDGMIRHMLPGLEVPGMGWVPSFDRAVYELYCENTGQTANPVPPTAANGFFYIPFTGAPGDYSNGYSIADVYFDDFDPADFAGRVVLIGPYANGLTDEYLTANSHDETMFGVEIHANVIDAMRAGNIPADAARLPQLILLFAITAGAMFFLVDRKLSQGLPVWLGICLVWIGACLLARRLGWVLHVLWIPLAATLVFIITVAVNYIRTAREKRKVQNTFGRYVDPAIIRDLMENDASADLGGKLFDIAVLFVDIRGFTTMSESLDPPTVVEIINRYLTLTTQCIMRHHGTLDKFVGDCTMAFWNAPLPQEDPVYLACQAAMDMVEGSKALGEQLLQEYGRTVSFGVGVHFGPAVVGNIGAPQRMDYTAIGDTVNTASRLESNAPAGTIYISREVADILGDRARTTSLGGTIKLKGKAEGFEVLTLDSLD